MAKQALTLVEILWQVPFFVIGTVTVDCQKEGETNDKQGFGSETQKRSGSGYSGYFPPFYTKPQMENVIFSLLERWKRENEKENT